MRFRLPKDWIEPDAQTGALPRIAVGQTTDTWLDVVNFWCALGYFMQPDTGNTVKLEFPPNINWLQEKNAYMTVPWWESLCSLDNVPNGDVDGWQAVFQIHPDLYPAGEVPVAIPNASYVNDAGDTVRRLWNQWGTQNHVHYYLPAGPVSAQDLTNDRYFIPTWSWGNNILGSEMMWGQNEAGVNIVDRREFQTALNDELMQVVPIEPSPM